MVNLIAAITAISNVNSIVDMAFLFFSSIRVMVRCVDIVISYQYIELIEKILRPSLIMLSR